MKKHFLNTLLFLLILSPAVTTANIILSKNDSSNSVECLNIIGIALGENNEVINGVEVTLYKENEELEWTEITSVIYHDHNFSFTLESNSYYTIEVAKPGFISRMIAVSTKLPSEVSCDPVFSYGFEVSLFQNKNSGDNFYQDFPVALIRYDNQSGVFLNSDGYTKHIKRKMKESDLNETEVKTSASNFKQN
ncbi:MAG: hypothetical protein M3R27_11990 [Bacteroidota bacterium]|nr:hypothetical protein [Bacteroidota bacterium]